MTSISASNPSHHSADPLSKVSNKPHNPASIGPVLPTEITQPNGSQKRESKLDIRSSQAKPIHLPKQVDLSGSKASIVASFDATEPQANFPTIRTAPPTPPLNLSEKQLEKVQTAYRASVQDLFQSESPRYKNTPVQKYGRTLNLLHKLKHDPKFKNDPQAKAVLGMRETFLNENLMKLSQNPKVEQGFQRHKNDFLTETLGPDIYAQAQSKKDEMLSSDYVQKLQGQPSADTEKQIKHDLRTLALVDPQLAAQTDLALNLKLKPESFFPKDAQKSAKLIAQHIMSQVEATQTEDSSLKKSWGNLNTVADRFDKALGEGAKAMTLLHSQHGVSALWEEMGALGENLPDKDAFAVLSKRMEKFEQKMKGNKLGSELSSAQLHGTAERNVKGFLSAVAFSGMVSDIHTDGMSGYLTKGITKPNPDDWGQFAQVANKTLESINTGASVAKDGAAFIGKNIGWRSEQMMALENLKLFGSENFFKAADNLGKAAKVITEAQETYKEIQNEDMVGTASHAVQTGSAGLAAANIGLTALYGAGAAISAPVLATAGTVALAATAVNAVAGESELTGQVRQELRQLGVSDTQDEVVKKFDMSAITSEGLSQALVQISQRAAPSEKAHLMNYLMDQQTDSLQESALVNIVNNTSTKNLSQLLPYLDTEALASELESESQAQTVLKRLKKVNLKDPALAKKVSAFEAVLRKRKNEASRSTSFWHPLSQSHTLEA